MNIAALIMVLALVEGVPCTPADYPFFKNCDPIPPAPCNGPCFFDCPRKKHIWLCSGGNCRDTDYYRTHCAAIVVTPTPTLTPTMTPEPTPTPSPAATMTPSPSPTVAPTAIPPARCAEPISHLGVGLGANDICDHYLVCAQDKAALKAQTERQLRRIERQLKRIRELEKKR